MFHVYVIKNNFGKRYTGQTEDLESRLKRHNGELKSKARSYTKLNSGIWELVYQEVYETREEAVKREKELKSYQGRQFLKKIGI